MDGPSSPASRRLGKPNPRTHPPTPTTTALDPMTLRNPLPQPVQDLAPVTGPGTYAVVTEVSVYTPSSTAPVMRQQQIRGYLVTPPAVFAGQTARQIMDTTGAGRGSYAGVAQSGYRGGEASNSRSGGHRSGGMQWPQDDNDPPGGYGGGRGRGSAETRDGGGRPTDRDRDRPHNSRLDEAGLGSDRVRAQRANVAEETLEILKSGRYTAGGEEYDIRQGNSAIDTTTTLYVHDDRMLEKWRNPPAKSSGRKNTIDFLQRSTVASARDWATQNPTKRIGVLNFASAKKPGGGFRNGAEAQEESLARASNLYLALTRSGSSSFYKEHLRDDRDGYYTDTMIYTRSILIFRDGDNQLANPLPVDMLTSAAVNAGSVRKKDPYRDRDSTERRIAQAMLHRMGKILRLFEDQGCNILILGAFGTGVFQNGVAMVAQCWARLLGPMGRFAESFEHVEFAILGEGTWRTFMAEYHEAVNKQVLESDS